MAYKILFLALAGAAGTLSRYGLCVLVTRIGGAGFPWGTLAVNLAGCFAAGFLWILFEGAAGVSEETRLIVLVGFMGAFTTFSTFILETGMFAHSSNWMFLAGNVIAQNVLGFGALMAGIGVGRLV